MKYVKSLLNEYEYMTVDSCKGKQIFYNRYFKDKWRNLNINQMLYD